MAREQRIEHPSAWDWSVHVEGFGTDGRALATVTVRQR